MKKEILVVIDCEDRARFFNRFNFDQIEVFAISTRNIYTQNRNFKVTDCNIFIFIFNLIFKSFGRHSEIKKSIDFYKNGRIRAMLAYVYGYTWSSQIIESQNISKCFLWNGSQAFSCGVSAALNEKGIKKTFLELANVPGKIFSDHLGVNKQSSLYTNIDCIENLDFDSNKIDLWLNGYLDLLRKQSVPQQYYVQTNDQSKNSWVTKLFSFFDEYLQNNKTQFQMVDGINWYQEHKSDYIFVPLQVSSDTQLLLNSKITNKGMVKMLLNETDYKDKKFTLKFHPCDSQQSVNEILDLIKGDSRFKINQGATYSLINNCSEVITINSTVGMEAKIMHKKVTFLGESFFDKMSRDTILKYICNYLLPIDYFSSELFTEDELNELLH